MDALAAATQRPNHNRCHPEPAWYLNPDWHSVPAWYGPEPARHPEAAYQKPGWHPVPAWYGPEPAWHLGHPGREQARRAMAQAMAQAARWSPLRAAFVGAVAAVHTNARRQ